jgi:Galactose oxidase, central domain
VLLIFGGMTSAGPSARFTNDVWAYAPATNVWTPLSANGAPGAPSPRAHAAAAWDPATNRLLIVGGQTNDTAMPALANDLWAFTLNGLSGAWTQLSPNGGSPNLPPPRQWAQMAWDVPAGVLRLFGGKSAGGGALSDTWTWAPLSGWQYENVPDQPAGRLAAGYYWDDTHARFVVGPGLSMLGNSDDVWAYDPSGHVWLQVPTAAAPTPPLRQMAHMVWDAADNQALLFGGRQQGAGASNDLWALVPTGLPATPIPAPPSGTSLLKAVDIGQTVNGANHQVVLTPATVQRVATSGASVARISFYLGDGATSWTPARLHAYEQVITMLAQQGIGILAVAGSGITGGWSPANWTQNAQETTGGNGDNPAIQDYARQLSLLVSHFHDAPYNVRQWEVWNEPNVPLAGCFTFAPSCLRQPSLQPSNFAALLAETYMAVKGTPAMRDVQLISGGIFGHSINGAYSAGAAGGDYLRHTYDEGINQGTWTAVKAQTGSYPLDAVGEHLYVDQSQRTTRAVIHTYLDWFHSAYAAYEGAAKGTAMTEVGWRTGDPNEPQVTPDIQALNLDSTFEAARRASYVQDLCWFELQDAPGYLHNTSWGLLDRTGQAKLAYVHFQQQ